MKVKSILNDLLQDVTPDMHKVRRKSLNASVLSLISGAALSVTSLVEILKVKPLKSIKLSGVCGFVTR